MTAHPTAPALEVTNLAVSFGTRRGDLAAVRGISFQVAPGEVLGLVGESGSGKSITGLATMGLIDPPGRIVSGSVKVNGHEMVGRSEANLRRMRGREISMIFQDPSTTLNPVLRVDTQMIEALRAHDPALSHRAARDRCVTALAAVGIPSPEERLLGYPHQFSGGMRQRLAIAIALLNRPAVLIADEPTTALDVTIQSQVLGEVQQLAAETGTALVWITHDLSVVAGLADRIAVMYAGRIVETGPVADILTDPRHPYTAGLIASVPSRNHRGARLAQIPGATPSLVAMPTGCPFHPRCDHADATCRAEVPAPRPVAGRAVACHHPLTATATA
ncbi:MAG: ABC transporter ATP-binding protein [Rhodobacterales bacterium]|nr:ABC transporter ATP-binding protein [Rhodobacterales bacterium]MDX5501574.1 ABC transporter ATP-binding protein [Rhodobacterales bacterium]